MEPETSGSGQDLAQAGEASRGAGSSLARRLRNYFFAGLLVTGPAGITVWLAWKVVEAIDERVVPLIPAPYNPETYLPFSIPGIGVVVTIVFLILVGALAAGFVGRVVVGFGERLLHRMPVIRNVYGALQQIFETVMSQKSTAFRQVVLFEYPRRGSWAIGFITGRTEGEIQHITEDDVLNVFLPTTPNPTSGYLLFIPRQELVVLDMTVEEGIKMVVSGGIVTPPDRRPPEIQKIRKVAAVDADKRTIPMDKKKPKRVGSA
ncbi:MAG: DUF502 domain-containing protein [Kiloniellales bacterium]